MPATIADRSNPMTMTQYAIEGGSPVAKSRSTSVYNTAGYLVESRQEAYVGSIWKVTAHHLHAQRPWRRHRHHPIQGQWQWRLCFFSSDGRGRPFGTVEWRAEAAKCMGLESSLRNRGRRRKRGGGK